MKPVALSLSCVILACCSALLAGCNRATADTAAAPAPAAPILQGNALRFPDRHPQLNELATEKARAGRAITVEMPARLVWNEERTQRLYAPFGGRVTALKADVGQAVRPGTPLASIASADFGQAQADAARARADDALARQTLERQRSLLEAGVAARKDLEQAEAEAARAAAELSRAQARLSLYGRGTAVDQQFTLSSGIAGVVVERNLNPMQDVRPDQIGQGVPPLFVVTDPTSLWVQVDARETESSLLPRGTEFELVLPSRPGEVFRGRVLTSADALDPATRTLKVRGVVANPQRLLKAEMLGTARVVRDLSTGVVVPAKAVMLRGSRHLIFVRLPGNLFEQREVKVLYQGTDETVLASGVKAGEDVVVRNALLLARQYGLAQEAGAAPAAGASKP